MINRELCLIYGCLILFDILTGIGKSYLSKSEKSKTGNFQSDIMRKCGLKKIITFIFCIMCGIFFALHNMREFEIGIYTYYILAEAMSIFENLNKCGIKVPRFIKNLIKERNDKND